MSIPGIYCQICKENIEKLKTLETLETNYSVYYIEEIATKNPLYVGITNNIKVRFLRHFQDPSDLLYKFHDQDWNNLFRMVIIKGNITRAHALDIETKYIQDFLAQGYKLYNKTQTKPRQKKVKYTRDSCVKIKCIETNEIFNSWQEAMRRYNVSYKRLVNACTYGDSAGIDNDLQPLHWCYEPFKEYTIRPTSTYTIYVLEEFINYKWIPFYVGVTRQTLQYRLWGHYILNIKNPTYNSQLYNKLCAKGKEHFNTNIRIRAIQESIVNRKEAYKIEKEIINKYNKIYSIVNKVAVEE